MAIIEVHISDSIRQPTIDTRSQTLRITTPQVISYESLMNAIGAELTNEQALELYAIWCKDDANRVFTQTSDGVLITLKDPRIVRGPEKGFLSVTFDRT